MAQCKQQLRSVVAGNFHVDVLVCLCLLSQCYGYGVASLPRDGISGVEFGGLCVCDRWLEISC